MKTKPLTFLLSLTFLFLFSGSSSAELFSPADFRECYLDNIKNTTNPNYSFSTNILKACDDKFAQRIRKDSWWWKLFGPKTKSDCILKYTKGVRDHKVLEMIRFQCKGQTHYSKDTDKNR